MNHYLRLGTKSYSGTHIRGQVVPSLHLTNDYHTPKPPRHLAPKSIHEHPKYSELQALLNPLRLDSMPATAQPDDVDI